MMKRLLPLLALGLMVLLTAFKDPQKPDMAKIREAVTDPASPYFYPKLMDLYMSNDTAKMNLEHYRHLYLGSIFQEDFNPYRVSPYAGEVESLYYISKHSQNESRKIEAKARQSLDDDPFNLQQIDYLIYAYRELKKNNLANLWQYRLNHLLEAIVSTGTGIDRDHAWYVISPQHEYFLLNRMGRIARSFEFEDPWFDHIIVEPKGPKDSVNYYFNSHHFLDQYRLKFPDEDEEPAGPLDPAAD